MISLTKRHIIVVGKKVLEYERNKEKKVKKKKKKNKKNNGEERKRDWRGWAKVR